MTRRLFVPGRIEVLGKHTDYAGGRSLLCALDRGFTVDVEPAEDAVVTVVDRAREESVVVPVKPDSDAAAEGDPEWAVYPRAVVRRVARDFPGIRHGCRIRLSSDLPEAAGLSSSSALITAVFLALDAATGLSDTDAFRAVVPDRVSLAGYLGAVERGSPYPPGGGPDGGPAGGGVGTRGGSEDHVAILCAEPGHLVRYAFEPVRKEGVIALPGGRTFVIAASGVRAEKAGRARPEYNRLSDRAVRAAELWRSATGGREPHMGAILALPDGYARLRDVIMAGANDAERNDLLDRVRHFAAESVTLVPDAARALEEGDFERFGDIARRSQRLAERLLGNQVPETVHLARSAHELGARAASSFGAGFGGSVWAMVPTDSAVVFLNDWRSRYHSAFPKRAGASVFFTTPAAAPARNL